MFKVTFTYDEELRKWTPTVQGASGPTEARQGFSAVVISCQQLDPNLLSLAQVKPHEDVYEINPAVFR